MKKLLLFLIASVFAINSNANVKVPLVNPKAKIHQKASVKAKDAVRKTKAVGSRRAAPPMITEQPEGEVKKYSMTFDCIYSVWGYTTKTETICNDIVFNEDKVYFKNLFGYDSDSWVEGTLNESRDKITVSLGQCVYWSEDYQYGAMLGWGKTDVTSEWDEEAQDYNYYLDYKSDETKTEVTFSIDPTTGAITLDGSSGDINAEFPNDFIAEGLARYYSDDLSLGALVFNYKMTPVLMTATVPANPTADEWYDSDAENGFSKFYFTLPTTDVDGNPLNVEWLSYRIYTDNDQLFTFSGVDYSFDLNADEEITEVPYSLYSDAVDFHEYYVYLYRTNAEGFEPLFNWRIGIQAVYTADGVTNVSDIVYLYIPTVPANPIADEWYDCGDESGFSRFYFTLPTTDVNGNPLNPEWLSYRIYTDNDQLFTFPAQDYTYDLTEDITEVPYSLYSDAVDFCDFYTYFYRTNMEGYEPLFNWNIGIQAVYTVNGVANASDIVYLYNTIALVDNADNSGTIEKNDGKDLAVILKGRTLYKDGNWNTLCLPFSLTAEEIDDSPLAGADIRRMASGTVTGHHVDLTFEPADGIEAGTPYIIKWEEGENLVEPTFSGVTIDKATNSFTSTDGNVQFIGYYDPFTVSPDDNPLIYYLGADNKLRYTAKERTLNACRAYFIFTATEAGANDFTFDINFGDGTDAITGVESAPMADAETWFTLDGRKLSGKPTKKGIYVTNGQKAIIK